MQTITKRRPASSEAEAAGVTVNDIHSRLNPTRVSRVQRPTSTAEVQSAVAGAAREGLPVCIAGGRHAMGGQQFAEGALLLDMGAMNRITRFDPAAGIVEAGAGIQWPELMRGLAGLQRGKRVRWGIAQKQTGADRLSLGGALAANVHGRGLRMRPFIGDVEAFTLVDASGRALRCSREENRELFGLAIGGYGLFGVVVSVALRLTRRTKVQRVVDVIGVEALLPEIGRMIAAGAVYGDFQFATDPDSDDFLDRGVLSTYRPVAPETTIPAGQRRFTAEDWRSLLHLAHSDKTEAFERYAAHYRATDGQIYWSDTHQLSTYLDDYHRPLDRRMRAEHPATEVITEIYVPRHELAAFMADVRADFRAYRTNLIYGTVRFIERDVESFLAWAREPYACIIFNLCTPHTPEGARRSADAFRRLIDRAMARGGSYYLTYHRHASREQVLACHPRFPEFLELKKAFDPDERFQSEWYRHYREMFSSRPL